MRGLESSLHLNSENTHTPNDDHTINLSFPQYGLVSAHYVCVSGQSTKFCQKRVRHMPDRLLAPTAESPWH